MGFIMNRRVVEAQGWRRTRCALEAIWDALSKLSRQRLAHTRADEGAGAAISCMNLRLTSYRRTNTSDSSSRDRTKWSRRSHHTHDATGLPQTEVESAVRDVAPSLSVDLHDVIVRRTGSCYRLWGDWRFDMICIAVPEPGALPRVSLLLPRSGLGRRNPRRRQPLATSNSASSTATVAGRASAAVHHAQHVDGRGAPMPTELRAPCTNLTRT